MNEPRLKPCPWCGETAFRKIIRQKMDERYFVDHLDAVFHLKSSIGFETPEEAAAEWNRQTFGAIDPREDPKCQGCKCLSCTSRGKADCLEGEDLCHKCSREGTTGNCPWYDGA